MNRSPFNDGFYFSTSWRDHGPIHHEEFRGLADCGPTVYAGWVTGHFGP